MLVAEKIMWGVHIEKKHWISHCTRACCYNDRYIRQRKN